MIQNKANTNNVYLKLGIDPPQSKKETTPPKRPPSSNSTANSQPSAGGKPVTHNEPAKPTDPNKAIFGNFNTGKQPTTNTTPNTPATGVNGPTNGSNNAPPVRPVNQVPPTNPTTNMQPPTGSGGGINFELLGAQKINPLGAKPGAGLIGPPGVTSPITMTNTPVTPPGGTNKNPNDQQSQPQPQRQDAIKNLFGLKK